MFADRGYEAVTLRAIAKEIGYTHAVIYQHFPDKSHILAELSNETIGLLIRNFDAIVAKHPALKERLFATSRGLIQFCTAHPQQFRNVFFGPENRNGIRAGQYIDDIGKPLFQPTSGRRSLTGNLPTNGRLLPDVIFRVCCSDGLGFRWR
jgi:AcrR family transcriptional regulator